MGLAETASKPINPASEGFGLKSVKGFCQGDGPLDDLRSVWSDAYRKSRRLGSGTEVINDLAIEKLVGIYI